MRSPLLLIVSLLANLILGAALMMTSRRSSRPSAPSAPASAPVGLSLIKTQQVYKPVKVVRTNVLMESFSWSQVESGDYRTYIANLRTIGCPEPTIRDIISADVGNLYARRRAEELPANPDQWSAADTQKNDQWERERRNLLTQLLGSGWQPAESLEKKRTTARATPVATLPPPLPVASTKKADQAGQVSAASLEEIQKAVKAEEARIEADTNLTPEQKAAQLDEARQAQRAALRQLLGEEAYKRLEEATPK